MSKIPNDPARPVPHISDLEDTVRAVSVRAGDTLLTQIGWHLVTSVRHHDGAGRVEILTVDNLGHGQAWLHDPGEELRIRHGNLRHPLWCDPAECAALDPLIAQHRGPAVVVLPQPTRVVEATVTVQLWQDANEPAGIAHTSVVVTFDAGVAHLPDRRAYDLELDTVQALGIALSRQLHNAARDGAR